MMMISDDFFMQFKCSVIDKKKQTPIDVCFLNVYN
jgi:hypothetical protein